MMHTCLFLRWKGSEIIVKAPFWIPEAPMPANARATMSIFEPDAKA